ncbi:cbb3-type cytochrome c oxidase subunit II [Luteimonas sp. RIT-PG2_3]|jgi:cytochrome c oxidase cbb3-type subunit 2
MENELKLIGGAIVTLMLATIAMIVVPFMQTRQVPVPEGKLPYSAQELRGRQVYIANGCIACHTQQPGNSGAGIADASRGWGRRSTPGDYFHDRPTLLGTMRTGPDLFNVGERIPADNWHLVHLYQPRAYVPDSTMPAYPFLFDTVASAERMPDDDVIPVPEQWRPAGKQVIASAQARDLVAYLKALRRDYLQQDGRNAGSPRQSAIPVMPDPPAMSGGER